MSLAVMMPPVELLPPVAETNFLPGSESEYGRISAFRSVRMKEKVFVLVHLNQVNTSPVTVSLLQGQDVSGTGSKSSNAVPIFQNSNTTLTDALVASGLSNSVQMAAAEVPQILVFEALLIEAIDTTNAFITLAVQTSCAAPGNIVSAVMLPAGMYASPAKTTYTN